MARILGLDLGSHSVKALLLESSFRGFSVRSFTEMRRTEEGGLAGALAALRSTNQLAADQVIVAAPGLSLATQIIELPFSDARRIESTIGFQLEGLVPYELDELVYDYQVLEAKIGQSKVLVGTMRSDELGSLLSLLRENGVDPRIVTSSAIAWQNCFVSQRAKPAPAPSSKKKRAKKERAAPPPAPPPVPVDAAAEGAPSLTEPASALETLPGIDISVGPEAQDAVAPPPAAPEREIEAEEREPLADAIADLGHERCSVAIASPEGELLFARTFAGGGLALTRAIAREFEVTLEDAQAWKENEGSLSDEEGASPESERAAEALRRGLAPIVRELRASVLAHKARFKLPVGKLWLTGGTSRLRGLAQFLSHELGLPVELLNPIPRDPASDAALPEPTVALAAQSFALALRGHSTSKSARFNLRKGPHAFRGDLDYLKGKLSRLVGFAALLALLAIASSVAHFRMLATRERGLDDWLCETTKRVLGDCQKDYLVALSRLKGHGSPVALLPSYSALDLFAELTERAAKAAAVLETTEITLDRGRVHGKTDTFEGVDKLVAELKSFKCFQEIRRGKVAKSPDGSKVEFDLDLRIQCDGTLSAEEP